MKILIIAGFLGAGKTTFIEKLIEKTKKEFVLLENEYGEVDVDSDFLRTREGINIWELTEGCICCSLKADITSSILTIANTLDPEYLIIEPTGVALLSNLMNNLKKIEYEKIEILPPIGIIDANDYLTEIDHQVFIDNIIKNASVLLLSKGQDLDKGMIDIIEIKWNQINPQNIKVIEPYENKDSKWFESLLTTAKEKIILGNYEIAELVSDIESISHRNISFESLEDFRLFASVLMREAFGKIFRVKGYCVIAGIWTKVDIVTKQFALEKIREMKESKLVFIGENLNKKELNIYLDSISTNTNS